MEFQKLQNAVMKQFKRMQEHDLYRVETDRNTLWDVYLKAFPKGTDPVYKERTEHDCQCCKGFIRTIGNVVAIIDGKVETIWDVQVEGEDEQPYQVVADKLAKKVKTLPVVDVFFHYEDKVGTAENYQETDSGVKTWNHFFLPVPKANKLHKDSIPTKLNDFRTSKEVLERSLTELTNESVETTLELIEQNSLYRGEEHKFALTEFQKLKKKFDKIKTEKEKDLFCWLVSKKLPASVCRIRNTVIGSLLVDLSAGVELETAVKAFETKVAPTNYKRPTALVTKAMIDRAKKAVEELGLTDALERRYATVEDITINNILFVDRSTKKRMKKADVFEDISNTVSEKSQKLDKVEEINIEKFIQNVLPKAESVEVLVENRHSRNLVSLIAPANEEAKPLFKWPNNFSWSYTGELADSIKERVKNAGGRVDGDLRCSLSWYNYDDLDLHMFEPDGYQIYFGSRGYPSPNKGVLDVDMNAGMGQTRNAVENITYPDRKYMKEGVYTLKVNNYCRRESVDVGFEVEIEFDGNIQNISYAQALRSNGTKEVAQIKYSRKNGFEIISSLPSTETVKEMWGVNTQSFHKVSTVMLSPNHWDEKAVGNKHYFFMLDKCLNDGKARGFFNEFLSEDLNKHRKVLEIVGSKMKTDESDNQLSGLGFSSTQRGSVLCRVKGNFTRTVKVTF